MSFVEVRDISYLRSGSVTQVISAPAGAVVGDVLLMILNGPSITPTTVPAGWTQVKYDVVLGTRHGSVWTKVYAGEATYTFAFASAQAASWVCIAFKNAQAYSNWIVGAYANRAGGAPSTSFTTVAPSITTVNNDSTVFNISLEATTATGDTVSVSQGTKIVEYFPGTEAIVVSRLDVATPGVVAATTSTYNNTQTSNGGAFHIAIPGIAIITAAPGLPVGVKQTVGVTVGHLHIATALGVHKPVAQLWQAWPGYPSVGTMLSTTPFFVAHRGGSASFPEMSLHAYTQSVVRQYGALELSLARTSDGVWFGLHDQTLDRTSQVTGVTAATLTWAQVQTYNITIGPGPAKPYMRLEQLLDAYGRTHILFIDPKYANSQRTELMNKVRDYFGSDVEAAKRVVYKYSGIEGNSAGTSGLAVDARNRGYKTWGYFYQADFDNGQLANYQGRWSILGMDYNANQAAWNAVKSYGKPVIAHILPTEAAKITSMQYGCSGMMVSGTGVVKPSWTPPDVPLFPGAAPTVVSTVHVERFDLGDSITAVPGSEAGGGDVLVVFLHSQSSTVNEEWVAPDTTWKRVSPVLVQLSGGQNTETRITSVFAKVLTGAPDPGGYTFTSPNSNGQRRIAMTSVIRGAYAHNPVQAWTSIVGINSAGDFDVTLPSLNTLCINTLELVYAFSNMATGTDPSLNPTMTPTLTLQSSANVTGTNGSASQVTLYTRVVPAQGATGTVLADFTSRAQRAVLGVLLQPDESV